MCVYIGRARPVPPPRKASHASSSLMILPRHSQGGIRRFCTLHGLTGAEAGVVAGLMAGLTLNQIALRRRTSPETVRIQLKAIFWKTGCKRQADLVPQVAVMAQNYGSLTTSPILIPDRQS